MNGSQASEDNGASQKSANYQLIIFLQFPNVSEVRSHNSLRYTDTPHLSLVHLLFSFQGQPKGTTWFPQELATQWDLSFLQVRKAQFLKHLRWNGMNGAQHPTKRMHVQPRPIFGAKHWIATEWFGQMRQTHITLPYISTNQYINTNSIYNVYIYK